MGVPPELHEKVRQALSICNVNPPCENHERLSRRLLERLEPLLAEIDADAYRRGLGMTLPRQERWESKDDAQTAIVPISHDGTVQMTYEVVCDLMTAAGWSKL